MSMKGESKGGGGEGGGGEFISISFYLFNYSFLAALGVCCCMQAFSSCGEWGLLLAVASLVAEHGL